MNAIIKFSGVSADGLARMIMKFPGLAGDGEKRFVVLQDVRLEEKKTTFLVTVCLTLVDEGTVPKIRMRLQLLVDLFLAIDPRLIPEFDRYGDGDQDLEQFKVMEGIAAPFEVSVEQTGMIILQKSQKIALSRLKEIVGSMPQPLKWNQEFDQTNADAVFLDGLLCWRGDGGIRYCEFKEYRKEG